ncbi:MAG: flagellar filament capping protein FliD, partial [Thermoanaerobaculia bacterium]
ADTLETLAGRIDDLDFGVSASVLNDGSPLSPYRLQLLSRRSGDAGGIIAAASGGTSLSLRQVSRGRDAVLFYGDGPQPVLLRSPANEFSEVIPGLGVTAQAASGSPVVVTAARDLEEVEEAVAGLVEGFNEIIDEIRALTRFDPETGERGPLLGEGVLRSVERQLADAVIRPVLGTGAKTDLASQIGLRITANGRLTFDRAEFASLAASDPEAVERIFTRRRSVEETTPLADLHNGQGLAATPAGAELRIHRRGGTAFDVDLSGDLTVRDLLASINGAAGNGGTVTAATSGDGRSLVLTDATTGSSVFRIEPLNGSSAAFRLGIDLRADSPGGGTITGREIDLTRDPGVGRRLFDALEELLDTEDGALQARADLFQSLIDDLKERSEARRELLEARELQLRQQFAQLEVLLGRQQNTLQRLTASLSGLQSVSSR